MLDRHVQLKEDQAIEFNVYEDAELIHPLLVNVQDLEGFQQKLRRGGFSPGHAFEGTSEDG